MKILFCYQSIGIHSVPLPLSESLAKLGHKVINCGPGRNQDIKTSQTVDINKILQRLREIDLIFIVESSFLPSNLEKCKIPKAIYLIDSHLHFHIWHKEIAKVFDFIFLAQKKYVKKLKKIGIKNVFYLPCAYDLNTCKNLHIKRIYDFGYVGTFNPLHNPKKSIFFALLKRMFNAKIGQEVYGTKMAKIYNQSKITVNLSNATDLNLRTFESMACGSMLLTDIQDKLLGLFQDRKHLVVYKNYFEVPKLINYYLKNQTERLAIAKKGQKEVLKNHTYNHRAKEILERVEPLLREKRVIKKDVLYSLGRSYFFLYHHQTASSYLKKFILNQKGFSIKRMEAIIFFLIAKYIPPKLFRIFMIFFRITYKILD